MLEALGDRTLPRPLEESYSEVYGEMTYAMNEEAVKDTQSSHCHSLYKVLRYADALSYYNTYAAGEVPSLTFNISSDSITAQANDDDLMSKELDEFSDWITSSEDDLTIYDQLLREINDLPTTSILFLQNIQNVSFSIKKRSGPFENISFQRRGSSSDSTIKLTREKAAFVKTTKVTSHIEQADYHIMSYNMEGMPRDERRKGVDSVTILLAFPFDPNSRSAQLAAAGQHIFTDLPVKILPQLNFLVQSDFILETGDLVTAAWNDAIVDGVARAFALAVTKFTRPRHPLRNCWLDYLPKTRMEGIWSTLYPKLLDLLREIPIIPTWTTKIYKLPSELRYLTSLQMHGEKPLFKDLPDEVYVDPLLFKQHQRILKELGVLELNTDELLDRLEADLRTERSKLRTCEARDEWHNTCASLLLSILGSDTKGSRRLEDMSLIPVLTPTGVKWQRSPKSSLEDTLPIYFPTTRAIPIPNDLIGCGVVDPVAASVPLREKLFRLLGVEEASKETIMDAIRTTHESYSVGTPNTSISISHFGFLFRFHDNPESLKTWIRIPAESGKLYRPCDELYFPSDKEFDTQQLLGVDFCGDAEDCAAFISRDLVDLEAPDTRRNQITWKQWLERATSARYFPLLYEGSRGLELSKVILAVLERSPDKFVGLLQAHWNEEYEPSLKGRPWIWKKLEECEVPCESGMRAKLNSTYLPTPEIEVKAAGLGIGAAFPFVQLPILLNDENYDDWKFLEHLGVNYQMDIKFYKVALQCMQRVGSTEDFLSNVSEVYREMASIATLKDQNSLKAFFRNNEVVFCPRKDDVGVWMSLSKCVWQAPSFLTCFEPIERHYGSDDVTAGFFTGYLGLQDTGVDHIIEELESIKQNPSLDSNAKQVRVKEAYEFLNLETNTKECQDYLRNAFEKQALIFLEDGWYKSSVCLWATPCRFKGFQAIGNVYTYLETFFVTTLGIKSATVSMLLSQIQKLSEEPKPKIRKLKNILVEIGLLMAFFPIDTTTSKDLERLRSMKFLPMRRGDGTMLVGADEEFVILDHERYGKAFQVFEIALDFSLEEVQTLDAFFQHMKLENRYLSSIVKEVSSVDTEASKNEALRQKLRSKAYALYCCAAKFKSKKAFRGDIDLYKLLSELVVYSTDRIWTDLVLDLKSKKLAVQSDRKAIHYDISAGQLEFYVPNNEREQNSCWRSQLPEAFRKVMGIQCRAATFPIQLILSCDVTSLDDVMEEQDITPVSWITRPTHTSQPSPRLAESQSVSSSALPPSISPASSSSSIAPDQTVNTHNLSQMLLQPGRQRNDSGFAAAVLAKEEGESLETTTGEGRFV